MKFQYQIITVSGDLESGVVDAVSERAALRQLNQQELKVVDIRPERARTGGRPGKVKRAELLQLFDELVTLLRSGVTLADAVDSLAEAQSNDALAVALEDMSQGLQQGKPFSEVLAESDLKLPEYLLQLAAAGELSGKLADALTEGVEQMRFDEQLRSETSNALLYPLILVISGILAVGLVFTLVVPKFSNLLNGEVELPWLAEFVLKTGLFFNQNAVAISLALLAIVFIVVVMLKRPEIRSRLMDIISGWPVVGDWLVEAETGRWTAVLGSLLSSGVSLMDALMLANRGVRIPSRRRKLMQAAKAVKGGESLSAALKARDALLPTAYNILRVGEKAGELPAMLKSLATLYEKSGRNRMKRMLILIEPLAILLIGAVIGTIILGIVLAITSASDIPL